MNDDDARKRRSTRLARGQSQAGEKKLAVLRVAIVGLFRHHHWGDFPKSADDLTRLTDPPHVSVARSQETICQRISRIFLERL